MSEQNTITRNDIQNAYRKLKSHVYYDNFFIFFRQKMAEFESGNDFEERLEKLLHFFQSPNTNENNAYLDTLLNQISYNTIPKKYKHDEIGDDFIISNRFTRSNYSIEQTNFLVDAPVEIHIICVLWILNEGKSLVKFYTKSNYAYALEFDKTSNEIVDGLRLFKPYFEQYQSWRDEAINTAQHFVEKETDILLIGLDVKQYFYNIDLKKHFEALEKDIKKSLGKPNEVGLVFTPLLLKIHDAYQKKLPAIDGLNKNKVLPIGLLSSGILGNWFLKELDQHIINELSPAYYGRYVDDILIVLSNTRVDEDESNPKKRIFDKFFVNRNILKESKAKRDENTEDDSTAHSTYQWMENPDIEIQKDKISIFAFDSKESKAVLDKFRKKIEQNSSAFWLLPDEDDTKSNFDESVYELTYTDTINKIRSIQGIKQSKYGAAVFLAKKIKLSLMPDQEKDEKTTEQILTFFKGRMNLEFNSIWEKALTYFVINNEHDAFYSFVKETTKSIGRIRINDDKRTNELSLILKGQGEYLTNCMALAISLNPNFLNENLTHRLETLKTDWFSIHHVPRLAQKYRATNLLRHAYVVQPLLNFTSLNGDVSYIHFDLSNYRDVTLNDQKLKYAPRFVYLHEFTHFYSFKKLFTAAHYE